MALTNNLVLVPKDWPAVAEAMSQRQPGDHLELRLNVCVVENLPERMAFDVDKCECEGMGGGDSDTEDSDESEGDEQTPMMQSVLGVMGKKKK